MATKKLNYAAYLASAKSDATAVKKPVVRTDMDFTTDEQNDYFAKTHEGTMRFTRSTKSYSVKKKLPFKDKGGDMVKNTNKDKA